MEQLLVIIGSLKGYFGSREELVPFVRQTMDYARAVGKSSVVVFVDLGSFFYYDTPEDFVCTTTMVRTLKDFACIMRRILV